ncbi:glycosyltransferase family 1 protein [Corallococcus exercitus]|uniref:Glycosyltransferase family 1 protein n=1 Tax=Corallococcus exercitus TaxID=2316736 RepID=A0A7Y4KMG5_9BACT|nr:glycosyltransferase [Corallococcus exercitus]NOK35464.1 glycosyltransferase family 1 protein [Corallococcus exercitus]
MSTILFVPLPERGHINPTFKLARALQKRGHRIIYCSLRDTEDFIRAEGFDFECLFESLYPKGFQARSKAQLGTLSGLSKLVFLRDMARRQTQMLEALLQGEFDALIARTRPDLGVVDILLPEPSLVLHGHRVPAVALSTSIPLRWEPRTPPTSSGLIPDERLPTLVRNTVDWGRILLDAKLGSLGSWVGLEPDSMKFRRALARKHGYPVSSLDFGGRVTGAHEPLLVPCPREFVEFRGAKHDSGLHYTGPCIDLERQEPDFPWERLEEGRPLVVCSLGTMVTQADQARRFHHSVAQAARQRPGWQFVVATNQWTEEVPGGAPANLVSVKHVPQLRMLRRATAMVTHGGFNSIKECIYFGVPMLVLPVQWDQPGMAARVAHHGLGVRASIDTLTPDLLLQQLEEIRRPSYRAALERMQSCFQAAEQEQALAGSLEQHLVRA